MAQSVHSDLLDGEQLVTVDAVTQNFPSRLPDYRELLQRMTAGGSRPPVASLGNGDDEAARRFEAVFATDAMRIAELSGDPEMQWRTLVYLAERQGLSRNQAPDPQHYDARHEEPGRIFHEDRDPETDDIARRLTEEEGWQWPMFIADHSTPAFVKHIAQHVLAHGAATLDVELRQRDGKVRTMGDAWRAGIEWILGRLDADGLLYSARNVFHRPGKEDLVGAYPIWQDSRDSALRSDGSMCVGPVAFVEVQALVFDALCLAARVYDEVMPDGGGSRPLRTAAMQLQRAVVAQMLVGDEQGDFFAYGVERLDGVNRPLVVRKSNPGHLLDSAILEGELMRHEVACVVRMLFDANAGLFSRYGVRTLATGAEGYRAGGYHTGQVWLWEQAIFARGLRRHGHHALADLLDDAVVSTCDEVRHFPEYVRGDDEPLPTENEAVVIALSHDPHFGAWQNTVAQPGQVFQGWSIAAYAGIAGRAIDLRRRSISALEKSLLAASPDADIA